MCNKPIDNINHEQAAQQEIEFTELVCSPEFTQGCIDPLEDIPVPTSAGNDIKQAPINPTMVENGSLGKAGCSPEDSDGLVEPEEEMDPIHQDHTPGQPVVSFTEVVCSPEFPQGCVDPLDHD